MSSPVFGHGGCVGVQAFLGVKLKAAVDEGPTHADVGLQLGQLVLHGLNRETRAQLLTVHLNHSSSSLILEECAWTQQSYRRGGRGK